MEKATMHSLDMVNENIKKIGSLFPECVTETVGEDGNVKAAIDFEKLQENLSHATIGECEERYQFTWPGKREAIHNANAPTSMTLRPCKEESVDFDNTENLYIEGDNLEVLKLLQENYLGKIKMIYIDPPYNTGNDFVYNDDFKEDKESFESRSGMYDEEGNMLLQNFEKNTESNGRFHTDWLNMMYPRLKIARNLLSDDGVIFISIDDNEVANLHSLVKEIFGESNFIAKFPWRKRTAKADVPFGVSQDYEWIICCAKSNLFQAGIEGGTRRYFESDDFPGKPWRIHDLTKQTTASERPNSFFTLVNPKTGEEYPANPNATWRITKETLPQYENEHRIIFPGDYDFLRISKPVLRYWKEDDEKKAGERFGQIAVSTKLPDNVGMSQDGTKEITELLGAKVFSFPKSVNLLKFLFKISTNDSSESMENSIILDFFSGSATTAHAVMQLNADDGGKRKYICVQLPEKTAEDSEAYKAGYKTICEIGKERIRRAGKKIMDGLDTSTSPNGSAQNDNPNHQPLATNHSLDIGFRVLKLAESNMKDVFYSPAETTDADIFDVDNVKADRTPLDLLFQVMPECNLPLSSKIEERIIEGKTVYFVEGNYLVACFDSGITDNLVKTIIDVEDSKKPYYFYMRNLGLESDKVLDNFEQLFVHYSPTTKRKVI